MTSRYPTPQELTSFPEPNYVDPITRRPLLVGVMGVMTVAVIILMSCRLYSRTVLVYAIGWDDWIMLLATICAVGNNIITVISTLPRYQMGYHIWDIKIERLLGTLDAGKFGLTIQLISCITIVLTKVSILLTYLRIFPSRANKWFCYFMLAYTVSLGFASFWLVLYQCNPPNVYWETYKYMLTIKDHCLNVKAIYFFWSAQNTFSDFLIFLWPVKDIASVSISRRQRITLISMFSCGVVVCIAGSARIYYTSLYLYSYDVLWWGATVFTVIMVETGMGIICGSLPGCKPLMSHLFPGVFGTTMNGSNQRPRNRKAIKEIVSTDLSSTRITDTSNTKSIEDSTKSIDDSIQLQSFNTEGGDVVINIPESAFKADNGRAWRNIWREHRFSSRTDAGSTESQEYIIMHPQPKTSMDYEEIEKTRPRYLGSRFF